MQMNTRKNDGGGKPASSPVKMTSPRARLITFSDFKCS